MKKALFVVVCALGAAGCVHVNPYVPMSSHTIQVGEKQEADVLWVIDIRDDSLLRCYNSAQGPRCVPVQR